VASPHVSPNYPNTTFITQRINARQLVCDGRPIPANSSEDLHMAATTGTIKRITDKGFGFIAAPDGTEYFFHQSACTSTPFDSLREGDNVTFTVGQGPKGPRAENVVPA
jgi:CspA family cold shock protein